MRLPSNLARPTLAFSLMLTLLVSFPLNAQEKVRSDRRLPPGVLLYGSTPDIPATYEAFRNTSYGQLINSPELEAFRLQLLEKFDEEASDEIEKIEAELGMPLTDLVALAAGDATLAIVRPIGQPLGMVTLLEYGDHQDIVDRLITLADKAIADGSDLEKTSEDYNGVSIHSYAIETSDPGYPVVDVSYFTKDGQFVLTSSRALAESVIDRWDGTHEATFAEDEFYSTILKECSNGEGSTPDTIWYINPIGLTTAGLELVPQARPFVNLIPFYLPTLGLNRLKASGSTLELDAGEFNTLTKAMMFVDRPATGIMKIFELRPTLQEAAPWVPSDVSQYVGFDWNISGAYEAIESVYDGFMGPGAFDRQLTDLTRQANQDNLHLKRDVIDVLSGKMEGYYSQRFDGDEMKVDMAVSVGVVDNEKAQKLVAGIMEMLGTAEESEVRGDKVYSFPVGETNTLVTLIDQKIIIASSEDRLNAVRDGKVEGEALVNSAEYKRARTHIPADVSLLTYQSPASQFKDLYENLRLGKLDAATEGEFDFSVLPPFEKIEKYLVPSFGYFVPVEKGAYSVQFGLHPEN